MVHKSLINKKETNMFSERLIYIIKSRSFEFFNIEKLIKSAHLEIKLLHLK